MNPLPMLKPTAVGKPLDRVDGRLKVTGRARYAAEFGDKETTVYAALVHSPIAKGRIRAVDATAAQAAPGVLSILTSQNAPKLKDPKNDFMMGGSRVEERLPLSDDVVSYAGQVVAMVVADSFERARHAAGLVRVGYAVEAHALRMEDTPSSAKKPDDFNGEPLQVRHGDARDAFSTASGLTVVDQTYTTPTETHNPLETSATVATWDGPDRLTVYDATQWIKGTQAILAEAFRLPRENVRVICPFVGGAFGCKGSIWPHTILAAMAAQAVKKTVKLALTRQEMFLHTGHRPPTIQNIALAAKTDGKLQALRHRTQTVTSPVGDFIEPCGMGTSKILYASPAIEIEHTVYKVNVATPTFMRAPGESPGTFALESAMDELAYQLKIDPVELRLINHADKHPVSGKPWSSKKLKECYQIGAERFGWAKRNPAPRSMRDGKRLVGWGMATATYPGYKFLGSAKVKLLADGTAHVTSATHDLGTGAYTAFTQISADAIGLPPEKVKFELGDSLFPHAPVAGGSNSTATVGSAIVDAAKAAHGKIIGMALNDPISPLHGMGAESIAIDAGGRMVSRNDASKVDTFAAVLKRAGKDSIEAEASAHPGEEQKEFAIHSFGAQFCEVKIDPELPRVQVSRFVSVIDNGRVINPKTADSQIKGGVIMGIGMALLEETVYDTPTGLPATSNLADYHVCTHADAPGVEVHFIDQPDVYFNAMGARGVGEIGITGVAAAVANAVYHATGIRVRDLPITPEKLLL